MTGLLGSFGLIGFNARSFSRLPIALVTAQDSFIILGLNASAPTANQFWNILLIKLRAWNDGITAVCIALIQVVNLSNRFSIRLLSRSIVIRRAIFASSTICLFI